MRRTAIVDLFWCDATTIEKLGCRRRDTQQATGYCFGVEPSAHAALGLA